MAFYPISELLRTNSLKNVKLLATDMDGTLTQQGKFTPRLLESLEALAKVDISVLIVTGRSAGWVDGVKAYLPIQGAIAENGGVFYFADQEFPEILTSISSRTEHRHQLAETFEFLKTQFPLLQESTDNRFRLTDWTFDVHGLTITELKHLETLCQEKGWSFTYSTVQCHIKPLLQDKATSLRQVLQKYFPQITNEQIITIGDSPNDESLFDTSQFPLSVGVANVLDYRHQLKHQPIYVTKNAESKGFCELADLLIKSTHNSLNPISCI